jgi:hypothetical protein
MSKAMTLLNTGLANGKIDPALAAELERELRELSVRADQMEELLIMIVRTGWPWDGEGEPNAIHHASRDGFATAMVAARDLLGLDHLSRLTRTEPRT